MKKTLLATVLLASFGMTSTAMAKTATNTFQWSGNVPVITEGTGFEIVQVGAVDFNSGSLKFANTAGVVTFESSNEIGFNVLEKAAPGARAAGDEVPYTMTLESLKLGDNEQDPNALELKIVADGVDLVRDVASGSVTGSTRLKVAAAKADKTVAATPGSMAVVQAIVKISPTTI